MRWHIRKMATLPEIIFYSLLVIKYCNKNIFFERKKIGQAVTSVGINVFLAFAVCVTVSIHTTLPNTGRKDGHFELFL